MSGSGVQLPKWKSYTLPSVEGVHILREPPKSIHTRKKERVDMSDVTYMIRHDDSRINEGVSYLQRGVNPHTDVMYNNSGGGSRTNTFQNIQASNPYKVMKDGAFRPPIFTQEDILPLSRQRRSETAAITNPGIRSGYNIHNLESVIDKGEIHSSVDGEKLNYIAVRPTAVFKMQLPQEVFTSYAINDTTLNTSASSNIFINRKDDLSENRFDSSITSKNPLLSSTTTNIALSGGDINRTSDIDFDSYIKDNIILQNISPNFSILLYNPQTMSYNEVLGTTKDRLNIAVQSSLNRPIDLTREDGTPIKIKDYQWKIVQSAVGGDNLVLQILDSDVKIKDVDYRWKTVQSAVGGDNLSHKSIDSDMKIKDVDYRWKTVQSAVGKSGLVVNLDGKEMELQRNVPLYAAQSTVTGMKKDERVHENDPNTRERMNISASSSSSLGYGRKEAIHDKERNVQLRGMGSVGSSMQNFGSVPTVNMHSIPQLSSKNLQTMKAAHFEGGGRYS